MALQHNAATLARGNQFTGYGTVNAGAKEAVVSGGGVTNSTYPHDNGSYAGEPGSDVEVVFREGRYINISTFADYGKGIDLTVSHTKVEPSKYPSSEQANP